MTTSTAKSDLQVQLDELKLTLGDKVSLDDISSVVVTMLGTLQGDIAGPDTGVQQELQDLVAFIQNAHEEIAALRPAEIHDTHIPTAADELDAIVSSTEEAANKILEAAEKLEELAPTLDDAASTQLQDIVMAIYEASSFQDLTGQRITKVVGALHHIEQKVNELARAVGHDVPTESYLKVTDSVTALDEDDLLHGPAVLGATVSQDDIDALFG